MVCGDTDLCSHDDVCVGGTMSDDGVGVLVL